MRVTLEFDLDKADEKEKYLLAMRGWKYKSVLLDLDEFLRKALEHEKFSKEEYAVFEAVMGALYKHLDDRNVDLYG